MRISSSDKCYYEQMYLFLFVVFPQCFHVGTGLQSCILSDSDVYLCRETTTVVIEQEQQKTSHLAFTAIFADVYQGWAGRLDMHNNARSQSAWPGAPVLSWQGIKW